MTDADREAAREFWARWMDYEDPQDAIATALATARAQGREDVEYQRQTFENQLNDALIKLRDRQAQLDDAYTRGWQAAIEAAAQRAEGGRFLHEDAPDARFGRACAAAIRAITPPAEQEK